MKKIILSLLAAGAAGISAHAQIGFAPEAGINLATFRQQIDDEDVDDNRMRAGLRIGAALDFPIVGGLSIQPGLYYSMKGSYYKETDRVLGVSTKTEVKTRLNYLDIPINVVYKFSDYKDGFFISAGPYIGYALDGKMNTKTTVGNNYQERKEDIKFGDERGDLKRVDVGGNVGLGYMFPMGLFFRAQYSHGFTNLIEGSDNDDNSLRNSSLAFSLGIMIGGY